MTSPLALRLMRRELRGGLSGFRIFLACLALGIAVIAAVGSLAAAIDAGLAADSRSLLGGDVELHLVLRPADAAEQGFLARNGSVSLVTRLRAMALSRDGNRRSLIELKAVDGAYPLYGSVGLDPAGDLAATLADRDGQWGAAVAPGLLARLGAKLGDTIRIGDGRFVLRAVLAHEPDALGGILEFGPRVMVAAPALASTGLITPGTLVEYSYRLRLPPGASVDAFIAQAKANFPQAGWRIRGFADAAPSLQRLLDRVTVFLTLVGLTALLVGGVGVGNAVEAYLATKIETIATMKCLGASRRLIFSTYLAQILVLAGGGILLGVAAGAAAPFLAVPFLPASLPVTARLAIYPAPLLLAAAYGLLATLAFAIWPIGAACDVSPASLFRDMVAPARRHPRLVYALAALAAGLALALLAYVFAADRTIAAWFIAGAAAALVIFRLAAAALMRAAKLAGRPRYPGLRLALSNLYRPGASTSGVVASLGLGLAVLVAITLVRGNLMHEIDESLPSRAPSFFFIDLQPDQVADFDHLLAGMSGVEELGRVPSLRGRITALNGVPVERAVVQPDAQWEVSGDRGLTYAANPPAGSRVVAGTWWPADYHGPPLVSFAAELARGMGLKLGDTITINVLGRPLTATITSLREIDWTSLNLNFAIVLSPGSLDGAPQTFIATARTSPENEAALEREVTDRFPNVSAIGVRDALQSLSSVVSAVAGAIAATSAVTLLAGALVLAGAIAAGHRRRVYEAVVLKVLGATRADVTRAFLIEYGLLGLAAALIAGLIGTLAAYFVLTRVMHAPWAFLPVAVLLTVALSTVSTLAIGYAGTWRALGAKAAPFLRNE